MPTKRQESMAVELGCEANMESGHNLQVYGLNIQSQGKGKRLVTSHPEAFIRK